MVQLPITFNMPAEMDRERRMARIRRLSRAMARGCLLTSGLLAVAMLFYWTLTPTQALLSHAAIAHAPAVEIDIFTRMLAFGISMVPLGALIYGLQSARRCFEAFAAGQIFSREPIGRLKAVSIAVAASAILKPLAGAALSLLLSSSGATGAKSLALSLGSDTLIALIFAGTVAVIASVMTEAIDIADENKQFV